MSVLTSWLCRELLWMSAEHQTVIIISRALDNPAILIKNPECTIPLRTREVASDLNAGSNGLWHYITGFRATDDSEVPRWISRISRP